MKILAHLVCCLALVSASSAFAFCADFAASKDVLVGEWNGVTKVDDAALKAGLKKEMPTASEAELNAEFETAKSQYAKMSFHVKFNADGSSLTTVKLFGDSETEKGKWKVTSAAGAALKVEMLHDGEPEVEKSILKFIDKDTYHMLPDEGQKADEGVTFIFTRKK